MPAVSGGRDSSPSSLPDWIIKTEIEGDSGAEQSRRSAVLFRPAAAAYWSRELFNAHDPLLEQCAMDDKSPARAAVSDPGAGLQEEAQPPGVPGVSAATWCEHHRY